MHDVEVFRTDSIENQIILCARSAESPAIRSAGPMDIVEAYR